LWINEEWPSLSLRADDTILNRESISWKTMDAPFSDDDWVSKDSIDGEVLGEWKTFAGGELHPFLEKAVSIS
jgi:hypothetical protein